MRILLLALLTSVMGWTQTVPRPAGELAAQLTNGQQLLLSSMKGKVIVVAIMSPTCPHCQALTPVLNSIQKANESRGLATEGVIVSEMMPYLPDFLKRYGPDFPVAGANRDSILSWLQHPVMERFMVPQMVIIDRKFQVRQQIKAGDQFFQNADKNIRAAIEPLLNESATSKPVHKPVKTSKR